MYAGQEACQQPCMGQGDGENARETLELLFQEAAGWPLSSCRTSDEPISGVDASESERSVWERGESGTVRCMYEDSMPVEGRTRVEDREYRTLYCRFLPCDKFQFPLCRHTAADSFDVIVSQVLAFSFLPHF